MDKRSFRIYIVYPKWSDAHEGKDREMGNSLGLRLPKAAVEETGLKPGSEVEVTVVGRDLRVRQPLPVKRYRLEDLLAEMDRLGPEYEPETVDWGPDVGAEIIDDAYSRGEITLDDILKRGRRSKSAKQERALRRKQNDAPGSRRHRVG